MYHSDRKEMEEKDIVMFQRKFDDMDTTRRQSLLIMFPQV